MQRSSRLAQHAAAFVCATLAMTATVGAPGASAADAGTTLMTSGITIPAGAFATSGGGVDAGGEPAAAAVSANGRYVAFVSRDDTFTPGISPDAVNVFRKDRVSGAIELISRTTGADGAGVASHAARPRISDDGNRVSWMTDGRMVPTDTDDEDDMYVRDVAASTTTLATPTSPVSADISGGELSGDGHWIAFVTAQGLGGGSDANGKSDVYRRNLDTGALTIASATNGTATAANGPSTAPSISTDGRWVAFSSDATNLVAGTVDANLGPDVYAHDLSAAHDTVLVSAKFDSATTTGNGMSRDPIIAGTPTTPSTLRIAYGSEATNVADNAVADTSQDESGYLRAFGTTASTLLTRTTGFSGANATAGAYVASISDDAQRVAFFSYAPNLTPQTPNSSYASYRRDLATGVTTRISGSDEYAVYPMLSGDGNYATWFEYGTIPDAPELPGVFGRTTAGGAAELLSRPEGSAPVVVASTTVLTGDSQQRTVSADGRYVVFCASGGGLNVGRASAVYRRDLRTNALTLVSRATGAAGTISATNARSATIDGSGDRVLFSTRSQLDPADTNANDDLYLRNLATNTTTLVSRASGAGGAVSNGQVDQPELSLDGNRVAFRSASTNFGVADGHAHIFVRDLTANTTEFVDRANGAGGAAANANSSTPGLSGDGQRVVFASRGDNLSADDPVAATTDIYLRDLSSSTTTLLSRRPGLNGAKVVGDSEWPAISSDGTTAAFSAIDRFAATEAGPWGGRQQLVVRTIATGANVLASYASGGAPANEDTYGATLSKDGQLVAFESTATNLLGGRGGSYRFSVFVKNLATGAMVGPPAFGRTQPPSPGAAGTASISDNGQCLAFNARGHTATNGTPGDFTNAYLYVVSGTCPKATPDATPTPIAAPLAPIAAVPTLTNASVSNPRFRVGSSPTPLSASAARVAAPRKKTPTGTAFRFRVNTTATVTITILRATTGRKIGKRCVAATPNRRRAKACERFVQVGALARTGVPAGAQSVAFSGRIAAKKLPAGKYRAAIVATTTSGSSAPATVSFSVVPR